MKKNILKLLALLTLAALLVSAALAEVAEPAEEYVAEVEVGLDAMGGSCAQFASPTAATYDTAKSELTIYVANYYGPVDVEVDSNKIGVINGLFIGGDTSYKSFTYSVVLGAGKHTIDLTYEHEGQDRTTITVAGAATPKPTPKPTATPKPAAVKSVTVTKADKKVSSVTVNLGETVQLGYALKPAGATSTVKWSTAKKSIAKVDANGVVTGVKEGSTKITVTTANKKKATVTVKVVDPYKPTKIAIANGKKATMYVGDTLQLGYTLTPANAKGTVKWSTSKKAVAAVNASTGVVTAKKAGTAKITATVGKLKATITITVKKKATPKPTATPKPSGNATWDDIQRMMDEYGIELTDVNRAVAEAQLLGKPVESLSERVALLIAAGELVY